MFLKIIDRALRSCLHLLHLEDGNFGNGAAPVLSEVSVGNLQHRCQDLLHFLLLHIRLLSESRDESPYRRRGSDETLS